MILIFPNTFSYHLLRKHVKWSVYNQSLVRRGEIILGFDVINNWDTELKDMNKDKVGLGALSLSKYLLPFTWICQSVLSFAIQTDTEEGLHKGMLTKEKYPSFLNYRTISRRINKLDVKIKDTDSKNKEFEDEYMVIAIDRIGIKVTNRGQWLRDKWNIKKKGYLKIHIIAVNVKSKKILSMK